MSEKPHIVWTDTATTGGTSVPFIYDGRGSVITYFPGTTEHTVLQECIAMHERLTRSEARLEHLTRERDSWKAEAEMEKESNERLRAAVEAAGGLCECGHVEAQHNRDGGFCNGPGNKYVVCSCLCFKEATQPGEGEGER